MTDNQYHLVGFSLAIVVVLLLILGQIFVTPDYRPKLATNPLSHLKYEAVDRGEPALAPDPKMISVNCQPLCQFKIGDKIIPSRIDSDASSGVTALTLHFFDQEKGLIGYQDKVLNPSFYVIDRDSNLLQVIRLKLDRMEFVFQAYYPQSQQILFRSAAGEGFLYSANRPALKIL